jgi:predicted transcriptional regulator
MARPPMRPRSVKVDDELWDASLEAAEVLRTDVSTEIRQALRALVKRAARTARPDTEETQP